MAQQALAFLSAEPSQLHAKALADARPDMPIIANVVCRAWGTQRWKEEGVNLTSRVHSLTTAVVRKLEDVRCERVVTMSYSGSVAEALKAAGPHVVKQVVVAESRPACEGIRLAGELADSGLNVAVCTDAAVHHVISQATVVLLGADGIYCSDGGILTVVNKVGSANMALAGGGAVVIIACVSDKITHMDFFSQPCEEGQPGEIVAGGRFLEINPVFEAFRPPQHCLVITEDGPLLGEDVVRLALQGKRFREELFVVSKKY